MTGKGTPMEQEAAGRIQAAEAREAGGKVESGDFAARAQVRGAAGGQAACWHGGHPPCSS